MVSRHCGLWHESCPGYLQSKMNDWQRTEGNGRMNEETVPATCRVALGPTVQKKKQNGGRGQVEIRGIKRPLVENYSDEEEEEEARRKEGVGKGFFYIIF